MRLFQRWIRGPEMPKAIIRWEPSTGRWEGREVANDGRLVWASEDLLGLQRFMEDAGFDLECGD